MVLIEEEEEDDRKATPSSSKEESGARVSILEDSGPCSSSSSGGGGAEESAGQDADEEGWETASEGGDEFEEATGGGGEEEESRETVTKNVEKLHDGKPDAKPDASATDGVGDLENKLAQVKVEEDWIKTLDAANVAKAEGNALFGEKKFVEALQAYDRGLVASELKESDEGPAEEIKEIRSILYCNRAACYIGLDNNDAAVKECTKALELNPQYVKALVRRAQAREKLTLYEEAMADWNKVLEIDPGMSRAKASLRQLAPLAEEKREKLKAEMLSKLKEAGNSILGRFGMSIDNFKTVQDPNTGSYSIQFQR